MMIFIKKIWNISFSTSFLLNCCKMRKKYFLICFLFISQVLFSQSLKTTPSQATFGRYGSDCSSGRGACSFTSSKTATAPIQNFRTSKKISENTFLLEIKKNTLTEEEEIKIAGKPFSQIKQNETISFVQEQKLVIDKESLQNLDIDPKFNTVNPGNYPLTVDKETVKILFTLSEKT